MYFVQFIIDCKQLFLTSIGFIVKTYPFFRIAFRKHREEHFLRKSKNAFLWYMLPFSSPQELVALVANVSHCNSIM